MKFLLRQLILWLEIGLLTVTLLLAIVRQQEVKAHHIIIALEDTYFNTYPYILDIENKQLQRLANIPLEEDADFQIQVDGWINIKTISAQNSYSYIYRTRFDGSATQELTEQVHTTGYVRDYSLQFSPKNGYMAFIGENFDNITGIFRI